MKVINVDEQTCANMYAQASLSHGLSLYLTNLSRGRNMTPRSWEYEREDAQKVLERWIPIMKDANSKHPLGEEFSKFDLKQVEKFGPQGGIPPIDSKECWDVIEPLYTSSKYDDPLALQEWFPKAHEFGKAVFGSHAKRGTPLSFERVVDGMQRRDTLSTNSGFPRFTRRRTVSHEEIEDARSLAAYRYPAVVLLRYYYGKLRPVWMFPMSTNLIEASYQVPIQNWISLAATKPDPPKPDSYTSPWVGFNEVKEVLTQQWGSAQPILGGDTTKMDAHMRPAQLRLVYEIVKWYFQEQYWEGLERSLMYVTEIDLLWSKTGGEITVIQGVHGLASGSCWTQLSETVLQMFMAYVKAVRGQGIGDDFYWLSDMSADELVEHLASFGLPANPAKQSVGTDSLTFLQRYYHQDFFSREDERVLGAYYPTIRALGSILYPEKFHSPKLWNSDMFCLRNYMIMENCVDDPCFPEFVKFVANGQKDMIPFAKKIVAARPDMVVRLYDGKGRADGHITIGGATNKASDAVYRHARLLPGLWPSYNQEKQQWPLDRFESIVLASKLS